MKFDWTFTIKKHGKTLYSKTWVEHRLYFWNPISWIMDRFASAKAVIKEFWELATEKMDYVDKWSMVPLAGSLAISAVFVVLVWPSTIWLIALIPVAFIQNMMFTLVSRSRNSQDTDYHRYCAWGSNGVWFICQIMIVKNIWTAINAGQWWYAILAGVVYSLATTEGSVLMMKRLIKSESGKRRVGANDKIDGLESRIAELEKFSLRS
jgi:hypothetical protein